MTHAPRLPTEQRSFTDRGGRGLDDAIASDHRGIVVVLRMINSGGETAK